MKLTKDRAKAEHKARVLYQKRRESHPVPLPVWDNLTETERAMAVEQAASLSAAEVA